MRAKKSLGQNFLQDENIVHRIVAALGPIDTETVVEIGPGRGALTGELVETAAKVVAIEFDRDMVELLGKRFASADNFTLVNADALNFDYSVLVDGEAQKAKLVANLPYNISTPILQGLAKQRDLFSTIVLMFQREVVDRIAASAGGKERGFLSVIVEDAFLIERMFDVPPAAFWPVPKVWSSVVRLTPKDASDIDPSIFRKLVSLAFSQKRKTLLNNLRASIKDPQLILAAADIDGNRRAETLALFEWRRLAEAVIKSRE
jgi:16S rRNA (adenine1518-N6/adenine1519-N6)-dimethyltransferase